MAAPPPTVHWHGTPEEAAALSDAIHHNCGCSFGLMGVRTETCGVHAAMIDNQRWLDGLVFMRRNRECLLRGEFSRESPL